VLKCDSQARGGRGGTDRYINSIWKEEEVGPISESDILLEEREGKFNLNWEWPGIREGREGKEKKRYEFLYQIKEKDVCWGNRASKTFQGGGKK